jgi:hypothetical protein
MSASKPSANSESVPVVHIASKLLVFCAVETQLISEMTLFLLLVVAGQVPLSVLNEIEVATTTDIVSFETIIVKV